MATVEQRRQIHVYAVGVCYVSVCAPREFPVEVVESAVSLSHPTGLDHGWKASDEPTFASGAPQPCPCNEHPEERVHRLLFC